MYQIGKFSKITDIPVRTLRYYDEINLLKPEIVDKFTNYRYYTDNNIYQATNIKYLKNLGYSLEEICLYRDELTIDGIDNKIEELNNKKLFIEQQIEELNKAKVKKMNNKVLTLMPTKHTR